MHFNLVKASNRRYLEELKNRGHEMKPVWMKLEDIKLNLEKAYRPGKE